MSALNFSGRTFIPLVEGALWWPDQQALLIADLHLEKGSWFAGRGQFLPPYDSAVALEQIAALLDQYPVRSVWCLGDSFHDGPGISRLPDAARTKLRTLTAATQWTWITGNHDPIAPDDAALIGGAVAAEVCIDGILLRHEAVAADARPEISGHYHPKWRISHRGRTVTRRCFLASESKLILPSFGPFTGGLDAANPAFSACMGPKRDALVPVEGRLLRFPVPA